MILALSESHYVRRALEVRPIYIQGQYTMSIYLIHIIVYRIFGMMLFEFIPDNGLGFLFVLFLCWTATLLLSIPLTRMIDAITKFAFQQYKKILSFMNRFVQGA